MDNEKVTGSEEDSEFEGELIELTDEDGATHSFELVDTLERNGVTYVALITGPDDAEQLLDGDGDLVIMRIVSEDGEDDVLEMIDDEDEFNEISAVFMDRLSDLYEFDEDGGECDCGHDGCDCGHEH